jgi:hypothetical protein
MESDPNLTKFQRTDLPKQGPTSSEFMDVADKILKFIQPMHNWFPSIVKIEKVFNLELEQKFEEAKASAFGTHIGQKFHGTGAEGVKNIPINGFRLPGKPKPGQTPGMFGQGIYFATDSSKSSQDIYTKGSHKLLVCDVLIGNCKTVTSADHSLCQEKLRREHFDSVYAIRNSKSSGGVENDEFVIFDPRQAIVRYIVHYTMADGMEKTNILSLAKISATMNQNVIKTNVKSTRTFDINNPYESHYRNAESHFLRMLRNVAVNGVNRVNWQIESIDIVYNAALQKRFDKKKAEFVKKNKGDEVLAFHGTRKASVESILKENLSMKYAVGQAHGPGIYFSEFPDTSLGYGDGGLLLFRVLPGEEYKDGGNKPAKFDSKKVGGNVEGFGNMLIVEDSSQFVPYARYHFKK